MAFPVALSLAHAQAPQSVETAGVVVNWQNLQTAIGTLIQANEHKAQQLAKAATDAADLADYWKRYVEGLPAKE